MPLASSYSYPLLGAFWTILEIFLWVLWIWVLIYVFIDIFRSRDLSGWAKALWFIFVLFIPMIGVLVYLIARGGKMHQRAEREAQQQEAPQPASEPSNHRPMGLVAEALSALASAPSGRQQTVLCRRLPLLRCHLLLGLRLRL